MATNSLQEYLQKKYLQGKKKKSKTGKNKQRNCAIVDDDIDLKNIRGGFENVTDLELGEDAPQIANIIDDRPLQVRAEEQFGSEKWKVIGKLDEENSPLSERRSRSPQMIRKRERMDSDSDQSPDRESQSKTNASTVKKTAKRDQRHDSESDNSPVRMDGNDSDMSPPRIKGDNDQSPERRNSDEDSDQSPVRIRKKSDSDESPPRQKRPSVTMEGKRAGLQKADVFKRENKAREKREREIFNKMDSSVSGKGATTVIRDRSTGRKRNLHEEAEREKDKREKQKELEEKYYTWGRGLKQEEMARENIQNELHEMSKTLARYRDDVDLDKHLKEQERDGDPMLKFIKKKRSKEANTTVDDGKPRYRGPAPANRFNIHPGYRWDGVDRSNGFEKDRFTRINNQRGAIEDAYKWSIEDM